MKDMHRINRNVAKMAGMNAPEEDIDGYIASEGVTIDQVRNFKFDSPPQQAPMVVPETKQSLGRTVIDQGLQGATFGFGNKAADYLGASVAKGYDFLTGGDLFEGQSINDIYKNQARPMSKSRMNMQMDQNPITAIASNIGGAVLIGGAAGSTKLGGMAGNALRSGGMAQKIGKGAIVGAASGGLYGAGTSDGDKMPDAIANGATLGAITGGAMPVISKTISNILSSKPTQHTAESIKNLARNAYKKATDRGGVLLPEFTDKFLGEVNKSKAQTPIGKLLAGDDALSKIQEKLHVLKGKPITLDEAQEVDEFLSDQIDGLLDGGRVTKAAKKLIDVQTSFRNLIDNVSDKEILGGKQGYEALKEGRKLWAASARLSDIERIITRAEMMEQPATGIKTGFRTLYNNPSRMRGYSREEQKLIKQAAKTGFVGEVARTFGSRLIPIVNVASGNPSGIIATKLGSDISRSLGVMNQVDRANQVSKSIIERTLPQAGKRQPERHVNPLAYLLAGGVPGAENIQK